MTDAASDLRQQARDTFKALNGFYSFSSNFWRQGHVFDTVIDYFDLEPEGSAAFGAEAIVAHNSANGDWFDDYGWWGIAGLRAVQRPQLFPQTSDFTRIVDQSWAKMAPASTVWEKSDQQTYAAMAPRFAGGVWNGFWPGKNVPTGQSPCLPSSTSLLCGIQNTVMNGLYLVFTARLTGAKGDQGPYWANAQREHAFLHDWFDVQDPAWRLLRTVGSGVLVRERVSTYANGGALCGYRPDLAWAGDQGLILGGLVDMMRQLPPIDPAYRRDLAIARDILEGVLTGLFKDGVLLAWTPGEAPGGDTCDYLTGVAVFLRYLVYAFKNNLDLRQTILDKGYRDLIVGSVTRPAFTAACNDTFYEREMIVTSNRLALLVAAIVLSEA
ncbi:MAG TPA: hypothetical protein VEY93_01655 [Longimicrobium sp.]|nr:hypothetical protein [Longimicrobium sp.]